MSQSSSRPRADLLGIACSAGCAVHCASLPVVVAIAPTIGLEWLGGSLVHQLVAILCCLIVVKAIIPGWRQHRDCWVLSCAAVGIGLLMVSAFLLPDPCCEPTSICGWFGLPLLSVTQLHHWLGSGLSQPILLLQPYLTPLGGAVLIVAHVMNLDLSRRDVGRSGEPGRQRCDGEFCATAQA